MNSVIYDPLEEFESKYKELHAENTLKFFEDLVQSSGIDVAKNRETVKQYQESQKNLAKLKKKLNWLRFFRVLMCITVLLIPLVILKMTPKIRALRRDVEEADQRADALLAEAEKQMLPLNTLFTDRDSLNIIESTVPLISFDSCFSVKQEADMKINYDFCEHNEDQQSTMDVLAGKYNENPFLFENKAYIPWERRPITDTKPFIGRNIT